MRQRRRAERGHFAQARDRLQPAPRRQDVERRQRRLLLLGVGFVVLAILGLLAYGWFSSAFQPPRKTVATVGGGEIKLSDLVPYTVLDALAAQAAPDARSSLNNLMRDSVLELTASDLGVAVTDDEIEAVMAATFEDGGRLADPDIDPPTVLTEVGRAALADLLSPFDVDEDDYRQWVRGRLLVQGVRQYFLDNFGDTAEQIFVHWIVTASSVTAQDAIDRINAGEDFEVVAIDLNIEAQLSAINGEVGWMPRGVVSELDPILFDPEFPRGSPVGPLVTSLGSMVAMVTDGPSEEPVIDIMAELAVASQFQQWLDARADEVLGDVDLGLDDVTWIFEHLN
jgi:hypothetical protein